MKDRRWVSIIGRAREAAIRNGVPYDVWALPTSSGTWNYVFAVSNSRRFTLADFAPVLATLPRCAQRAARTRGGDSKVAFPYAGAAKEYARLRTASGKPTRAYLCDLPSPAIGEHWHLSTGKRRG